MARPYLLKAMHKALIIGYGNPLRSDDGFGWQASRLLAREFAGQEAQVITCHQLTPELAEPLSQCRRAVFIDADREGEPGDVHLQTVRPQAPTSSTFTHSCSPSGLLASAEMLYGYCPQALIITVTAQSFAFGESLSPVVSEALPEVVDQVCQFTSLHRQSRPSSPSRKRGARLVQNKPESRRLMGMTGG